MKNILPNHFISQTISHFFFYHQLFLQLSEQRSTFTVVTIINRFLCAISQSHWHWSRKRGYIVLLPLAHPSYIPHSISTSARKNGEKISPTPFFFVFLSPPKEVRAKFWKKYQKEDLKFYRTFLCLIIILSYTEKTINFNQI